MTDPLEKQQKIVIADDDEAIRELLAHTLEAGGYDVLTADNGTDAVKIINEAKPDLVILDIDMPGLSGFEVLEKLQNNLATRSIPVVFLTADISQHSRLKGLKSGAVEYFDKPFSALMLRRRIERILWKLKNEPDG